jgi:serine/threonine protein kinase/formylglycine-generating enzyme required for sulfatase activity
LRVKEELAGKKVRCPNCATVLPVHGKSATSAAGDTAPSFHGAPTIAASPDPVPVKNETPPPPGLADPAASPVPAGANQDASLTDFLAPPQAEDELGRLGHYRVLRVLGQGSMGVVFLAEDQQLDRRVALKVMRPALAASAGARQRFVREAKTAAAVEHDHIVAIFQVGEDRGLPYLAMPLLQGEGLDQRLHREGKLPVAEVLRIGRETAEGLAAAHQRGLIHRDIKPGNLWLEGARGRVKILDFGLARAAEDNAQLTQPGTVIGTPAYMAPEQRGGEPVDLRCDLFSLGCVLYRMATGQLPFKGKDTVSTLVAVALDSPRLPAEINPEVRPELSDLVMQLLAKKPADRPASAQAVADALSVIEKQAATPTIQAGPDTCREAGNGKTKRDASRTSAGPSPNKRPRSLRLVGGGVLGLGALAAALAVWDMTPHGLVRIESDDPSVAIVIDETGPTLMGANKEPIALRAGDHGIRIKRGDHAFDAGRFVLKQGQTVTLKVESRRGKLQVVENGQVIASCDIPRPATFMNSLGIEFVLVPRGRAWLGGGHGKPGDQEVQFAQDFYLGKYEVTQEEWEKVMRTKPSYFSRNGGSKEAVKEIPDEELKRFPVEGVSWTDVQLFLAALNKRGQEEGWVYRLPTAAEWEYACRGGPSVGNVDSAFDYYFDGPANQLRPEQANFEDGNGLKRPCKVGSYQPNRLGLYDMHGNVFEWCDDGEKAGDGPLHRVYRGGSWRRVAERCQAANRRAIVPTDRHGDLGFRVARVPAGSASRSVPVE